MMLPVRDAVYHLHRCGEGPALLMLHGFTGSGRNWQWVQPELCRAHTLLMPDLLGHGRTSAPPDPQRYRMEEAALDLIMLMDQQGIDCFDLLGYSMGGRLGLYMAAKYPQRIRRVILESSSPGLADEGERRARRESDAELADFIETEGMGPFVERWGRIPLFATQSSVAPERQMALREQRLTNTPQGLANSLRGMGTGEQPSLWSALPEMSVPVLLITGEADTKFTRIAEAMQASLPNARHQHVTGAGHAVHFEEPERYVEYVLSFSGQQVE